MIFEHRALLPATVSTAWDFLTDVPAIGVCIPGVEAVESVGDDRYRGTMAMKIGAIRLRFEGLIAVVERNREDLRARLEAQGADRRVGGSVSAKIDMTLQPAPDGNIELLIRTDAAILGKLGEFGQAVIRKKADQVMNGFAANVVAKLAGTQNTGATTSIGGESAANAADERPG